MTAAATVRERALFSIYLSIYLFLTYFACSLIPRWLYHDCSGSERKRENKSNRYTQNFYLSLRALIAAFLLAFRTEIISYAKKEKNFSRAQKSILSLSSKERDGWIVRRKQDARAMLLQIDLRALK